MSKADAGADWHVKVSSESYAHVRAYIPFHKYVPFEHAMSQAHQPCAGSMP